MNDLVKDELSGVLKDWREGKPIRSIAIGHPVRRTRDGQHERHVFRQKHAHEMAMKLIEIGLEQPELLESFPDFHRVADARAGMIGNSRLSQEEVLAAESLAWVALHRGWTRAIAHHEEHDYITLKREADA
jgi:hypothetical protein